MVVAVVVLVNVAVEVSVTVAVEITLDATEKYAVPGIIEVNVIVP